MSRFWHWLKHEFHEVLPPTIFFLIALSHRRHQPAADAPGVRPPPGLHHWGDGGGTAHWQGRAHHRQVPPFINRFPDKPLMYNVAWKTVIYVAGAILIHYLALI